MALEGPDCPHLLQLRSAFYQAIIEGDLLTVRELATDYDLIMGQDVIGKEAADMQASTHVACRHQCHARVRA